MCLENSFRRYSYSLLAVEREDHGGEGRTVVVGEKKSTKSFVEEGRREGGEMINRPFLGKGGGRDSGGVTPRVRRRSQGGRGEGKEEETVTVIRGSQFSTFLLTCFAA